MWKLSFFCFLVISVNKNKNRKTVDRFSQVPLYANLDDNEDCENSLKFQSFKSKTWGLACGIIGVIQYYWFKSSTIDKKS